MKIRTSFILALLFASFTVVGQDSKKDHPAYKHFISSSLFMTVNLLPVANPPRFYQLNYGHRFTPKDALIVEAITWQYEAPVGIPYGPSYEDPAENFPGLVRDYGIGLAYQRFWWKGAYSTLHTVPFFKQYLNEDKEKIQNGFMLFMTLRAGYHFKFLKNRLFLEPSVACTFWPVNTNMPESFQVVEDRWPNYFLFEPGLNVGFQF